MIRVTCINIGNAENVDKWRKYDKRSLIVIEKCSNDLLSSNEPFTEPKSRKIGNGSGANNFQFRLALVIEKSLMNV